MERQRLYFASCRNIQTFTIFEKSLAKFNLTYVRLLLLGDVVVSVISGKNH